MTITGEGSLKQIRKSIKPRLLPTISLSVHTCIALQLGGCHRFGAPQLSQRQQLSGVLVHNEDPYLGSSPNIRNPDVLTLLSQA
ncbi:hypothetical protein NXS19_003008 [Fusarium pseudograminearum]|nr:hypothetical protein NXS19_003008 [Fusarium pseudograminearum]